MLLTECEILAIVWQSQDNPTRPHSQLHLNIASHKYNISLPTWPIKLIMREAMFSIHSFVLGEMENGYDLTQKMNSLPFHILQFYEIHKTQDLQKTFHPLAPFLQIMDNKNQITCTNSASHYKVSLRQLEFSFYCWVGVDLKHPGRDWPLNEFAVKKCQLKYSKLFSVNILWNINSNWCRI